MKRQLLIFSLFTAATFGAAQMATAQNDENRLGIELNGGLTEYQGDLGSALFFARKPIYMHAGGSISAYLSPSFDVMLFGSSGDVGFYSNLPFVDPPFNNAGFTARLFNVSVGARYKLANDILLPVDSKIAPFLTGGWGFQYIHSRINNARKNYTGFAGVIHGGFGVQYNLNEKIGLRLQTTANYIFNDIMDGAPFTDGIHKENKINDMYMTHSLGVVINLPYDLIGGESKGPKAPKVLADTDKDGVADKYDKCPNTPLGVEVDEKGCPLDTDKDGVYDYMDSCKTIPGLPQFNGCPDTDGDGIPDHLDHCPEQAGLAENEGCPDLTEEEKQVIDLAAKGIYFETNSAVLKPESYEKLDRLVKLLEAHPEVNLIIEGHTDNVGNPDYNKKLSYDRVSSVKEYMVSKGIQRERLTPIGYGEEKPLYDNNTEEGRAKNRRVYFQVKF